MSNTTQKDAVTRIDWRQTDKKDSIERPFPIKEPQKFRVRFTEEAYRRMRTHADTSDEVELCGVLVGDVCRDGRGAYLDIAGAIEGEDANNYGAQVTFTQQTWDHIHKIRERDFPDQRIVGWYHTHPGFGVFLSDMDTFIQENFFNLPYQIAVVLETKLGEEGCFAWIDGKITPLPRYWVGKKDIGLTTGEAEPFRAVESPLDPPVEPLVTEAAPGPAKGGTGTLVLLLTAVCCLALGTVIGNSLSRRAMIQALQSEFYSIIEFVSLNTSAAEDFAEIGKGLREARDKLGVSRPSETAERLTKVQALVDTYGSSYHNRDRASFRREMAKITKTRQHLSARVETTNSRIDEMGMLVGELYLMRISELVGGLTGDDLNKLSKRESFAIKQLLDRFLATAPGMKEQLRRMHPELIDHFYPTRKRAERKRAN